jgi:hypothetical protein
MADQIPGVPEGWELVEFRQPNQGDWVINWVGQIERWNNCVSAYVFPIIRKIEKPAKYRQFKDAEEAHPFWDTPLRLAGATEEMKNSWSRITTIEKDGITTSAKFYTWEQAYYRFYVDDDGTPFGVKIDE